MQHLGVKVVGVGEGTCETALTVRPEMQQQHGYVHAGILATLADHTARGAARSVTGAQDVITIEFKINFFRPALGPELRARARVRKARKTLVVAECEVVDGGTGKAVASLVETLQVIPGRGPAMK